MHPRVAVVVAAALALSAPGRLLAQCPDGTPPPCRGNTSAAGSATRRPNPPLDDRTWIILPFENVARAQDIDWLMDASVNLLYLDMSKWRDIRVIDDERVADLIREVPGARGGLTLQSGLAVARRAGAGKLVMGDLLKVGSRTQIVAKVFDVRTGQRLRNVREETATPDSLMALYGRLARGILNAGAPTGAVLGTGTMRLDAYQAYVSGVRALNAFDIDQARRQFAEALRLDSSFALAHYKLSIVLGWSNPNDRTRRAHAEAAARLAAGLPARERALITAQAQASANEYGRACETLAPLVRADSNDVEALYNLGECLYHDAAVVPVVPGDTTRWMFRASFNSALWAFRRVLSLDPTYHLAFQHIQDAYQATTRNGCPLVDGQVSCNTTGPGNPFTAMVRREGDSLVTVPVRLFSDGGRALAAQQEAALRDGSRRRNLEEARRAAEEWVTAGPTEPRARIALGRALLSLGRVAEAAAAIRDVTGEHQSLPEAGNLALGRFEIALKLDQYDDARRLADSLFGAVDSVPTLRGMLTAMTATLGQLARADSMISLSINGPVSVKAYFQSEVRAALGIPDDSLVAREQVFIELVRRQPGLPAPAQFLSASLAYTMRRRSADQWTGQDTASTNTRLALVSWLARGDTARFRRELVKFDSVLATRREEPDRGEALLSAESHLVLGDSAAALQRLRAFRDLTWRSTPFQGAIANGFAQVGMLWPRTFLLLGDLAAAAGANAEAVVSYRRVLGLWQHGDPAVQPAVQHAREALARLGG